MYDSAKYGVEQIASVPEVLDGTATYTASDHVKSVVDVSKFEFFKKIKLLALKALIDTAPNAGSVAPKVKLMNGTTQLASVAIGTHTAGEVIDGSIDVAGVDADTELQIDLEGTGTASSDTGKALGKYYLYISYQRAYE